MTDETLKIALAFGVPLASAIGAYAARGLVSFGKHLFNDAIDARIQVKEFKTQRKRDARAIRELRIADERHRHGHVSVAPPSDEEDTGIYETMREEDLRWLEEQRRHQRAPFVPPSPPPEDEKAELKERMRRYVADESTPPGGHPVPPRPRPKMPSRPK